MATSYRTVHTLDAHHVSDLMELYRDEWWTNERTADEVRTLLGCSDLVIGFCDEKNDRLVAFARVLTDRVFRAPGPLRGHVVDFLQLPHWPIFNVADMCINIAAAVIILQAVRGVSVDGTRHKS
jgi:hypothetical protein